MPDPAPWTLHDRLALYDLGIADDPTTRVNRHALRPRSEAAPATWWRSARVTAQAASLGLVLLTRTVFGARPTS